jgi:hypothetical protein
MQEKGDGYEFCTYMKRINMKFLFIVEQLKFSLMGKRKRKHVEFAFIFLLLKKHRLLMNYESFEFYLFIYFKFKKDLKKD